MARTRRTISLEEKILKAEESVERAKKRYDSACEELKILLEKREMIRKEELMNAVMNSDKSYEEIMQFLQEKKPMRKKLTKKQEKSKLKIR